MHTSNANKSCWKSLCDAFTSPSCHLKEKTRIPYFCKCDEPRYMYTHKHCVMLPPLHLSVCIVSNEILSWKVCTCKDVLLFIPKTHECVIADLVLNLMFIYYWKSWNISLLKQVKILISHDSSLILTFYCYLKNFLF
jgi:hypothetical protein